MKALRIYGISAYGYDASEYAISQAPQEVKEFCYSEKYSAIEEVISNNNIDFIIAKDVFEHLSEESLVKLLHKIKDSNVSSIYIVVPLSALDDEPYIINSYENDKTHILRKSVNWWETTLQNNLDFQITMSSQVHGPVKENWTQTHKDGNLFILLKR